MHLIFSLATWQWHCDTGKNKNLDEFSDALWRREATPHTGNTVNLGNVKSNYLILS